MGICAMASDIGSNYDWLLYINNLALAQKKDAFASFLVELLGNTQLRCDRTPPGFASTLLIHKKKTRLRLFLVELRGVEPRSEPRSHVLLLS